MSAHDDYLDPDRHLWQSEDYIDGVLLEFESQGYKVDNDKIEYSDNYYGDTGRHTIKIVYADDELVRFTVHGVKQVDYDPDWSEEDQELAQESVIHTASQGEWTGDDWVLFHYSDINVVDVVYDSLGEIDFHSVVNEIITQAEKAMDFWVNEMIMVHEVIAKIESNYN